MSFIFSIGKYGGFYHLVSKTSIRLCLGWVAFTILFVDVDLVFDK